MNYIIDILASFLAVVVVLTLHEFAHAFVAYKCGDPTPKWNKRLSLNPMRHFDPLGLICFVFVHFGWAKPVAINPNNFKNYRLGSALTASAGVVINYICAFLFCPLFGLVIKYGGGMNPYLYFLSSTLTYYLFAYSLNFCVFNLLPLYPLDGFRLIDALNRRRGKVFRFLRENGYYILLGLILESFLCGVFVDFGFELMDYFDILGWIMRFAVDILGWPITKLWSIIIW